MSSGKEQTEAAVDSAATAIANRNFNARETDPVYLRTALAGAVLALIGFFLPWYSVVFAPPGGAVTVHHTTVHAFAFTYNGISESGTTAGNVLRLTVILLLVLAVYDLLQLLPFQEGTEGLMDHALRAVHLKAPRTAVDLVKVIVHVLQAIACLGFIFLAVTLGRVSDPMRFAGSLGGSSAAVQASHHLSVGLGTGFWLMTLGIAVTGTLVAKRVAAVLGILLAAVVLVAFLHHAWLVPFLHHIGF